MSILQEFEALSLEVGIALPSLLQKLLASGKTLYGPEWGATWRERMLGGAAPLSSWYDFEWIDAEDARQNIVQWLNPAAQNGKKFLPFAQTGAGDVYCLMPIDEQSIGVALIWHDDDTSKISYSSFDDFVIEQFLESFSDLDHHTDQFSEEEILQCIQSDVFFVTELMSEQHQNYLRGFCKLPLMQREYRQGPKSRPQNVLSLISQEQFMAETAKWTCPTMATFPIVARWEISSPEAAIVGSILSKEPLPDWRNDALDPNQKLKAIQSYRQEFSVNLHEAKVAIDQYIELEAMKK